MEIEETDEPSVNFVPCLTWVRRGACKLIPEKVKLSSDELAEIIKQTQGNLNDLEEEEGEEGRSKDVSTAKDDDDDIDAKYNMDDYDDEEDQMLSDFGNLAMYHRNDDDPILKAAKETATDRDAWSDASSDENDEDYVLKETDNLILVGHVEGDEAVLEIHVYNAEEEAMYVHHEILLPGAPICVEWLDFDPSDPAAGNLAAVGGVSPVIDIWDIDIVGCLEPAMSLGKKGKKKKKIPGYGHTDAVLSLAWNSSARNVLASGSADKSAIIWDLSTGQIVQQVSSFKSDIQTMQFHPTEKERLLTGCCDKYVREFDSRAPDVIKKWKLDSDVEKVQYDHFRPNNCLVSTESGMIYYYDTRTEKQLWQLKAHAESCTALTLSTQVPGMLLTGSVDKTCKLWDISNNTPQLVHERDFKIGSVYSLGCCPDVPWAFAMGGDKRSKSFNVWDCREVPDVRKRFESRPLVKPTSPTASHEATAATSQEAEMEVEASPSSSKKKKKKKPKV